MSFRKRYKNEHVPGEARRRMKAGSAVTGGMVSGGRTAVDLGVRKNATGNTRSGQSFRDVVSGGTEYHTYADGRRVAVKARTPAALRSTVLQQGQQGTPATSNAPAPTGSFEADVAQMKALHELAAAKNSQAPSTTNDPAKQERQLEMMRKLRATLGG